MLILVDSSVWIDHLTASEPDLVRLLEEDQVMVHPWVRGELALGSLKDRAGFLEVLGLLPAVEVEPADSVLAFVERHKLYSRGIGWVDAQLLASCAVYPCRLWTRDKRLGTIAEELGVGWTLPLPRSGHST